MLLLCDSQADLKRVFMLSNRQVKPVWDGLPIKLPLEKIDLIRSVCFNQLRYALPTRISGIMGNDITRPVFILWVNTAAHMLDSFRSIKNAGYQNIVVNGMDPFLASLYHMAASMDEVAEFLEQLHQYCPQFDGLFFRGTRFLENSNADAEIPDYRVPSSVDVLSLSPEDERIYSQLSKESQ